MPAPVLAAAGRALVQRGTAAVEKNATKKLQNAATSGSSEDQIAMLSGIALRYAWLTLIPSWGLTLLYINIHFMGKYLASSAWFCPFGSEWAPKGVPIGSASSAVEYAEIIALFVVDLLLLVILLTLVCMVLLILDIIQRALQECGFGVKMVGGIAQIFPPLQLVGSLASTFSKQLCSAIISHTSGS